jgi:Sec-independent protein translocase protein TatA
MGNFENKIPKYLKDLEMKMGKLRREVWSIEAEFDHDCNCEYCDVDPEEPTEEAQKKIDNLEGEITEIRGTIRHLKRHAEVHGITVEVNK